MFRMDYFHKKNNIINTDSDNDDDDDLDDNYIEYIDVDAESAEGSDSESIEMKTRPYSNGGNNDSNNTNISSKLTATTINNATLTTTTTTTTTTNNNSKKRSLEELEDVPSSASTLSNNNSNNSSGSGNGANKKPLSKPTSPYLTSLTNTAKPLNLVDLEGQFSFKDCLKGIETVLSPRRYSFTDGINESPKMMGISSNSSANILITNKNISSGGGGLTSGKGYEYLSKNFPTTPQDRNNSYNSNNNHFRNYSTTTTTTTTLINHYQGNINQNHSSNPYQSLNEKDKDYEINKKLIDELLEQDKNILSSSPANLYIINDNENYNNEFLGKCIECFKIPSQIEDIIILDHCSHVYCRGCLYTFIMNKIKEKKVSKIKCKCCAKSLSSLDIKQVLNDAEYNIYDSASLDQVLLKNGESYIKCPKCSLLLEKVSHLKNHNNNSSSSNIGGSLLNNYSTSKEFNENGEILSKEAVDHKKKFRVRCHHCSTVFCTECLVMPYHIGYTCAQYQIYHNNRHCKYCKKSLLSLNATCSNQECKVKYKNSCHKILSCGHDCCGVKGEINCLQCLHCPTTITNNNNNNNNNNTNTDDNNNHNIIKANDYCNICWVEDLESAPSIELKCGHIFHYKCCKKLLKKKWSSSRITFGFMKCPLCSTDMEHPSLKESLEPIKQLYSTILNKALQRLTHYGPEKGVDLKDPQCKYFKQPETYVMERFSYFMCFKCQKPYFGGEKACGENRLDFKAEELVCGGCSSDGNDHCKIHGKEYIEYKCKWCCNVSTFFCWGKTHMCDSCHRRVNEVARLPKSQLPKCKCDVKHPEGEEYCYGCSLCRILKS